MLYTWNQLKEKKPVSWKLYIYKDWEINLWGKQEEGRGKQGFLRTKSCFYLVHFGLCICSHRPTLGRRAASLPTCDDLRVSGREREMSTLSGPGTQGTGTRAGASSMPGQGHEARRALEPKAVGAEMGMSPGAMNLACILGSQHCPQLHHVLRHDGTRRGTRVNEIGGEGHPVSHSQLACL